MGSTDRQHDQTPCRSRREVREKIVELGRSGELTTRIAETAASAEEK
jgi:hypothetical protein